MMDNNKRIGRQHQIHYSSGEGKILCGVKKWQCSDINWNNVECKLCLRKREKLFAKGRQHERN